MTASQVDGRTAPPVSQWKRLAAVARERATEQSDKAAKATDTAVAGPHLEQQAYLNRLADIYEERARGTIEP